MAYTIGRRQHCESTHTTSKRLALKELAIREAVSPNDPAVRSVEDRHRQARRINEVMRDCAEAYPQGPVRIRTTRGQVGKILDIGFERAVEAIVNGNAELVRPKERG